MRGFFIVYYCKYIQFNVSVIRLKYTRIDFFFFSFCFHLKTKFDSKIHQSTMELHVSSRH